MVRTAAGEPTAPLGQRPAWAFERDEVLSSPEADEVCQRIPGPWEMDGDQPAKDAPMPGKFANIQDTMCLRQGSASAKRGLVSPDCAMDDGDSRGDDSWRRVRFQPRMRDGNVEGPADSAPTLQKGAASVFTVGKEPSDECGMFRDGPGAGGGSQGGFNVRQDTEVIGNVRDFEAREETEAFRIGAGGGFDIREDTEVLRIGKNGTTGGVTGGVVPNTEGFEIREDTEVLRPTATMQSGAFNVREDTEVLGNATATMKHTGVFSIREDTEVLGNHITTTNRNISCDFAVREDTEVLNHTSKNGTGAFAVREDTEVLTRGQNATMSKAFSVREDTEVLNRRENGDASMFGIRQDTDATDYSVFFRPGPPNGTVGASDGAFDVREDTEVLGGTARHTNTAAFSIREDTEVLGGGFAVRQDTEVLNNLEMRGNAVPSKQSGGLRDQQRADSVRVLKPPAPQDSCDIAGLRAPSGHLRPINRSGSLHLGDTGASVANAASLERRSQKLRESCARRKLQFGDAAAPVSDSDALLGSSDGAGADQAHTNAVHRTSSLLAGLSMDLPSAEDFTVLESEEQQACGGNDNALLEPASSQGRDSFLDDDDTENAAAAGASGAARAATGPGAARGTGLEHNMLRTLDDCPEYVIQWGSEIDADSVPGSLQASPVMHKGGSASLNASPLKHRGGAGNGGKPPLSPGQHLQGHHRRATQAQGAVRTHTSLGRQFGDSTLQSAAATINPFLPEFTKSNISKIQPLSKFSGVQEIPDATLRAFTEALAAGHAATLPDVALEAGTTPLGSGGYATVFSGVLSTSCVAGAAGERVALKVATPAAAWEFVAARVINERVPARYASLFLPARCIFLSSGWDAVAATGASKDAVPKKRCALGMLAAGSSRSNNSNVQQSLSVLVMPQGMDGTLLDLINAHKAAGQPIGESLVLYIALQMLLILHAMQQARVIHTDLKPDNCLLSWPETVSTNATPQLGRAPAWSAASASTRGSHWGSGCLQAIDFGRAIDLQLLPVGTQFDGVSTTEGMQCPEMLSGKSWHYSHDAFCVAATLHAVLLGKYIAVTQTQSVTASTSAAPPAHNKPVYRPTTSVPSSNPRKPLWDRLFRTLLNCPLAPERPDVTPLLAEFTSALETAETARPSLWHEMATARQLTAAYLSRRGPV